MKAHGVDGYNACFIKASWEVIKADVYAVIEEFFQSVKLPKIIMGINLHMGGEDLIVIQELLLGVFSFFGLLCITNMQMQIEFTAGVSTVLSRVCFVVRLLNLSNISFSSVLMLAVSGDTSCVFRPFTSMRKALT